MRDGQVMLSSTLMRLDETLPCNSIKKQLDARSPFRKTPALTCPWRYKASSCRP